MTEQRQTEEQRQCPKCKRPVTVRTDGRLFTHGPGPDGALLCPGGGGKDEGRQAPQGVKE